MLYINEINAAGKIAVDDTILVKDVPATAGSMMLENFKPLFSAEAVERLEKSGYAIAGKTNVGEFGLDLLGETSYFAPETENGNLVGAAASLVASRDKIKRELGWKPKFDSLETIVASAWKWHSTHKDGFNN